MSENAFDPANTHLWVRCWVHETTSLPRPETCIFVENCDDCLQYCMHDDAFEIHELLG
jgi:hypothetical protein